MPHALTGYTQTTTGAFVVIFCGRGSTGDNSLTFGIFLAAMLCCELSGLLLPATAFTNENFFSAMAR